ncbi:hypothetical protein QFW80_00090 [Luteimonas sp. M1R5S18]|uniref:Beta-lactamase n=1 Tax=Luteimonas rhizosphaericola TaxID=3042024 RepID=A0ABT6JE33_9GAMM|nr:hypothetical protein [Luteimonas rhizosphaericola]MDH5828923.1 hypothetical protein [Luteimonas rhizosphaericola]
MKNIVAIGLLISLFWAVGCTSVLQTNSAAAVPVEVIPLEQAKALITSGQVKEIFQPHIGCVVLTLQDGQYLSFDQPHLDWILGFLEERGLDKQIAVSME